MRLDLLTGEKEYLPNKALPGETPRKGFKVIQRYREQPRVKDFRMGFETVKVAPNGLDFEFIRGKAKGRERGLKAKLFRGRRKF